MFGTKLAKHSVAFTFYRFKNKQITNERHAAYRKKIH